MSSTPTVFVVDDDEAMRDQLSFTLKSVGLEVETCASADEFLESFDPARPGCLVLDVRMAGMDGLELQKRLSAAGAILPIVMISGHGDIPMSVVAVQAGAVDFLEKPFREHALLSSVKRAIKRDTRERRRRAERAEVETRLASLTDREREVLDLVVCGKHNKAIAGELGLSHKTVEFHRSRIMEKMRAGTAVHLARMVIEAEALSGKP